MQFFPTNMLDSAINNVPLPAASKAVQGIEAVGAASNKQNFEAVFSSFIEEGREEYCGLPAGFSALVTEGGTISRQNSDFLKIELKKRNVQEASLQMLDQLVASGQAVTIGKIFTTLSGEGRTLEPLQKEEQLNFTQALQKIGLSKETSSNILALAEEGKTAKAWQNISKQLESLGEEKIELHSDELKSILKALDISAEGQKNTKTIFKNLPQGELTKEQLGTLFAEVNKEIAAKTKASKAVRSVMRDAMADALSHAKLEEKSAPVADSRGSKQSNNAEQRMRKALSEEALNLDGNEQPTDQVKSVASQPEVKKHTTSNLGEASKTAQQNSPATATQISENADKKHSNHGESALHANIAEDNTKAIQNGYRTHDNSKDTQDRPNEQKSRAEMILGKSEHSNKRVDAQENNFTDNMKNVSSKIIHTGNNFVQAELQNTTGKVQNFQQEIFSQIEQGILHTAQNGAKHLTLQINQGESAPVTLLLTVTNGEVRATMRTDSQDQAALLAERIDELKASLEESGLKVAKLDVETRLGEDSSFKQWEGTNEHNLMHDSRERARMLRLNTLRREEATLAQGNSNSSPLHSQHGSGLNIVA